MDMREVSSSQIKTMGHDETTQTMRVVFHNGSTYEYGHVPRAVFDSIINAESVGSKFSSVIKKNPTVYPYRKV